jgi:hypothetical protein
MENGILYISLKDCYRIEVFFQRAYSFVQSSLNNSKGSKYDSLSLSKLKLDKIIHEFISLVQQFQFLLILDD